MADATTSSDPILTPGWAYDDLRFVTGETPCPYLSGRLARNEVYRAHGLGRREYSELLGRGFRRSGGVVYRPRCRNCSECKQLRIPVRSFRPTRSMRRILNRNADVSVEERDPLPTREKYEIYVKYLRQQHDGTMSDEFDAFVAFLYDTPFETIEFVYKLGDRLIGVSLVDLCADGLSSVYMYFDPRESRRSLGTYSVLWEIEECRRRSLPHYYLGYYVAESRTMAYKARFRPHQILVSDHRWITVQA